MPPEPLRLLLLGGTGEARTLAEALAGEPGLALTTSLAGRTRAPVRPPGALRSGGFGGPEGLAAWLEAARIDAVLDATHPFARRITATAHAVCRRLGIPYLRLERPPWRPGPGDRWYPAGSPLQGLALATRLGHCVFVNLGRADLQHLSGICGCRFVVRTVEPCDPPAPHVTVIAGRPPYTVDGDLALLRAQAVEVLLVRNAGGEGARPKLEAARHLGLPVVMIERPALGVAPVVTGGEGAQDWVRGLLAGRSR